MGIQHRKRSERGAALLLVSFIMVIVLVGGLAAVAVTSGELASSRGYRTRQITLSCANGGLERIRANMPDFSAASAVSQGLTIGSTVDAVTMRAGHYASSGTPQASVEALDPSDYDAAALFTGENITNVLLGAPAGGGVGSDDAGLQVVGATAVCEGSGFGAREMQVIFRYGSAMGAR
jgi:Tfp pilus assembly protein PilV